MSFYKCCSNSLTKLVLFIISRTPLEKHYRNQKGSLQRSFSSGGHAADQFKLESGQYYSCFSKRILIEEPSQKTTTLIFNVEGTLLKSPSLFPYFMLVAFEAGSLVRAFLLLVLYPFLICFVNVVHQDFSLKIMVMVCFFGIKKEGFRVGSSVLPKFFLEDVGVQGFEMLRKLGEVKVGVTDLPQVMVESFLRDYLEIDCVFGRELKVVCGYYVGLMDDKKNTTINHRLEEIFEDHENIKENIIGLDHRLNINYKSMDHPAWFSHCKEIYKVNEVEKLKWNILPREQYPKPLVFHDGRLAFRPTPLAMLAIFIWFPMGSILAIIRIIIALSFPYHISTPLLAFTGIKLKLSKPNHLFKENKKTKGILYVCNHRTLLDPLFLSFGLNKSLSAVTYSLSRMSEILAPIRTVRLTRDRDVDGRMMDKMLNQGDLVVCPEGTTCREPYLLRLSPLFTELSDDIVPVGMDTRVGMFYGTTAGGLKCLDPLFFLMNPAPGYTVRFLDRVGGCNGGANSRFEVANYVQSEIGKALEFECTMLTRKDKYLILAGNEGIVSATC